MGTAALIILPAALFVAALALVFALRGVQARAPRRPWWGNPAVWVVVSATLLLLGVFVFPRLLGFTFVFLPFLWIRTGGRGGEEPGR